MQARQRAELDLSGFDALLHFVEPAFYFGLGRQIRYAQQDVSRVRLLYRPRSELAVDAAAAPEHLQDVKTVRAAYH